MAKTYLDPLPLPPDDLPLAPMAAAFLRLASSISARCCLSFSARSIYSATLARIMSFDFWFFSPSCLSEGTDAMPGGMRTLQSEEEQLERAVVHGVGLLVVARSVYFYRLLDRLNRPPQKVGVAHPRVSSQRGFGRICASRVQCRASLDVQRSC
jgi:hypothetical protein